MKHLGKKKSLILCMLGRHTGENPIISRLKELSTTSLTSTVNSSGQSNRLLTDKLQDRGLHGAYRGIEQFGSSSGAYMFEIISICTGGGYKYCRTKPQHPRANSKGLYPLHRVLMEIKLNRLLNPEEVVHHLDGDKTNNSLENLAVLSNVDHSRYHKLAQAPALITLICLCGQEFTLKPYVYRLRINRNSSGSVYCSRRCGSIYS